MVTMVVVERNDERQKSGSLGVKDGVSLSSTKEIADPVVYKLVRVDGDGRIVPLVSHGANDKCSTQVGVGICSKPARFLKLSGSSSLASATCSSSTPDFSKIKGEDGVNGKCSTQVGIEMCLKPAGFLKLSGSSFISFSHMQQLDAGLF